MEKYKETILRYRVYKKRKGEEDTKKNWWLMTSHSTLEDAEKFANDPEGCDIGVARDDYKVVDHGIEVVCEREFY